MGEWILVSDRLPTEEGDYWVTLRHIDGNLTTEKYGWKNHELYKQAWEEVVVAWQPYYCPKPYGEK